MTNRTTPPSGSKTPAQSFSASWLCCCRRFRPGTNRKMTMIATAPKTINSRVDRFSFISIRLTGGETCRGHYCIRCAAGKTAAIFPTLRLSHSHCQFDIGLTNPVQILFASMTQKNLQLEKSSYNRFLVITLIDRFPSDLRENSTEARKL